MNHDRLRQLSSILSLAVVVVALTAIGGLLGAVFAFATAIVWLATPPVFAFVIAQAGLAAVIAPPYTLRVIIAELAVLTLVLTDTKLPVTIRTQGLALCWLAVITGVLWLAQPFDIWIGSLAALASIGLLLYAGHRYELLATGQLAR